MPLIGTRGAASTRGFGRYFGSSEMPPVPDYELFYEPTGIATYTNGSNITSWANLGTLGSGFDLLNTGDLNNRPTGGGGTNITLSYGSVTPPTAASVNGRPAAEMGASGVFKGWHFRNVHSNQNGGYVNPANHIFLCGTAATTSSTYNSKTYFQVIRPTHVVNTSWGIYGLFISSTTQAVTGSSYGGNYSWAGYQGSIYTNGIQNDGGAWTASITAPTANVDTILGAKHNSSSARAYCSNNQSDVTASPISYSYPAFFPGIGTALRNNPNTGWIYEHIQYNRTLTDSEFNAVISYLKAKYNIT